MNLFEMTLEDMRTISTALAVAEASNDIEEAAADQVRAFIDPRTSELQDVVYRTSKDGVPFICGNSAYIPDLAVWGVVTRIVHGRASVVYDGGKSVDRNCCDLLRATPDGLPRGFGTDGRGS